jgi:hypothetical protein
MKLFVAVVRSNLEFGNAVWSPKLEKDAYLVESVKRTNSIVPGLKGKSYGERLRSFQASVIDVCVGTSLIYTCILMIYTRSQKDY